MQIDGWKYYNHAAIPTTPPHEKIDVSPIEDGTIWQIGGKTLLARWTTDFDCGHETNWWHLIREAPFDLEDIVAKERKRIRQALKKSYVKKVDCSEYIDELYECYVAAHKEYKNADGIQSRESFINSISGSAMDNSVECWGGFDIETDKLIGYMLVCVREVFVEIWVSKFDPNYFKQQASDSLYYTVLNYYLNECEKKYVCSGSRNINHKTGTEEYKIRRFGYRKAYCHLRIKYNPKIKMIIELLYVFRRLLRKMDRITLFHQINAVLAMEEIVREDR